MDGRGQKGPASYTGRFRVTPPLVVVTLVGATTTGVMALLALSPQAWDGFVGNRPSLLALLPRPLPALLLAFCAGCFAWMLAAWHRAAAQGRPLVVIDGSGVTLFRLRGPAKALVWSDVRGVERRGREVRFLGGAGGRAILGRFPVHGQDLRSIGAAVRHHRPDLTADLR